jgi:chromosome segregation ATPase
MLGALLAAGGVAVGRRKPQGIDALTDRMETLERLEGQASQLIADNRMAWEEEWRSLGAELRRLDARVEQGSGDMNSLRSEVGAMTKALGAAIARTDKAVAEQESIVRDLDDRLQDAHRQEHDGRALIKAELAEALEQAALRQEIIKANQDLVAAITTLDGAVVELKGWRAECEARDGETASAHAAELERLAAMQDKLAERLGRHDAAREDLSEMVAYFSERLTKQQQMALDLDKRLEEAQAFMVQAAESARQQRDALVRPAASVTVPIAPAPIFQTAVASVPSAGQSSSGSAQELQELAALAAQVPAAQAEFRRRQELRMPQGGL